MPGLTDRLKVFLCGDVMTGRGIDQILPHPCDPLLHEGYLSSALDYVRLAEEVNGPISRPAALPYIWGTALDELAHVRPDLRLVNLETSITRSGTYWPKGINYRMSPENASCLSVLGVDCCALANNHILDFGKEGLLDTLDTLTKLNIRTAGAGRNLSQAWLPAIFEIADKRRVLVFSCAVVTSGPPNSWAALPDTPGIALLPDISETSVAFLVDQISRNRRTHDIVLVSLHWGPNWGYEISQQERALAHRLIDDAKISILHGHSSHHPKGIEIYKDRLILYGCGDFINDYEGISGYEDFRGALTLMYFAELDPASGAISRLTMTPLEMRRFQLVPPADEDAVWLRDTLDRCSRTLGGRVTVTADGKFSLSW